MKNKGISLIVLIITIVVIIILTGSIVLNILNNNPIVKANEAVFKSNIMSIQDEIQIYMSSHIQNDGTYIYPAKSDIKAADKYTLEVLDILNGKIVFKNPTSDEASWLEQLSVNADYTIGLVSNYKMNGNASDSIRSINNGIVGGATLIEDRFGNYNSAYSFDGLNDYISTGFVCNQNLVSNQTFSLGTWVKINAYPVDYAGKTAIVACNSYYTELQGGRFWYRGLAQCISFNDWRSI